jgi:hypothetical protein
MIEALMTSAGQLCDQFIELNGGYFHQAFTVGKLYSFFTVVRRLNRGIYMFTMDRFLHTNKTV